MPLIERFTLGGNLYPDHNSELPMLVTLFRRLAENRDVVDRRINTRVDEIIQGLGGIIGRLGGMEEQGLIAGAARVATGAGYAHTDKDGGRLPLGYTADGRLDTTARQMWLADIHDAQEVSTDPEWARAILNENNEVLWGLRWDGTTYPDDTTPAPAVESTLYVDAPYRVGGIYRPVKASTARLSGVGSSTMNNLSGELTTMSTGLTPAPAYVNFGKGGEWGEHIAARSGSRPIRLTFPTNTVPASGAVTVTSSNVPPNAMMAAGWPVLVPTPAGGTIRGTMSSTSTALTFTRSTAGVATTVAVDVECLPEWGLKERNNTAIINFDKNGLSESTNPERAQWAIDQTLAMVRYLAPLQKRFVVINHFTDTNTAADATVRARITKYNAWVQEAFGYEATAVGIDLAGYLTGSQVWTDTGITPTQADLDQQALGNKPPSLSIDNGHLNQAGEDAVVAHLIRPKLIALGYYA